MSAYPWMSQSRTICQLLLTQLTSSATSLGMMNDEEKKTQRIEDIRELLS